jgi:hypothetical protein
MRAVAVSFSELLDQRCGTHKFFFFGMIEVSLFLIAVSSTGFPPQNPPPMIYEKEEATTHHIRNPPLCKCVY